MVQGKESPAVACTLAAADRRDRLAWIEELNAALRDHRREGPRIELTYLPSAGEHVREFVRREQECCPFLDFTVRKENGAVILVIEAPQGVSEVADALFAAYTARHSGGA